MIIRLMTRSASSGAAALATVLLVLLSAPVPAAADSRTDPAARSGASGVPGPPPGAPAGVERSLLYESGTHVRPAPGAPALPDEISALSWLVADARTGKVLAAHNAHRKLPPASTLKTLFAITALPHLSEQAAHTVTESELSGIGAGSSLVGIVPGHTYEVADLWRGVFLSSGNDAVHVLAEMNGGLDATVTQMQEKASRLGALDTHVVSPDGYDAPGQVSSAYDLAVFGRKGLDSRQFTAYASTPDAQFPGNAGTFGIQNTNRLLTGANGVPRYPGLIGIKNGYTTQAGNTLVAAARRGERTVLVTVMNPQANSVYEEARALLDWGFEAGGLVTPVGTLDPAPPVGPGPRGPAAQAGPAAAANVVRGEAAAASEDGAWYLLPVLLTAGSAVAACTLFAVRRRARRG
ncbi:D-alanyl-D-alanine carboxypeptidase family protein [Streptomyces sp. NPDC088725]|uniref:D-alanyl-D-alanine carboxypeptidase family protein n=1 Tax=Streptomyces sp. NPDC088725 TaxID=3365873 RepID=UPI0038259FD0